jgi:Glycosyltransferase family 10 (fucosyltransferase) C-term
MPSALKIRLVGTDRPRGWSHPRVIFDPNFSQRESSGMLCWGQFNDEFITYKGVKAWYYPEPRRFSWRRERQFKYALRHLTECEFLHHSNPNRAYRIPIVTHYSPIEVFDNEERRPGIVSVVSNFGGRLWWLRPGARFRNSFVCQPEVHLFGNPDAWRSFRRWPWSRPQTPPNYLGPWESNWYLAEHTRKLSEYRFALCLENGYEPYYFTEKFVNAVRARCVPIYRAHPTVRETILRGALWIDPADHSFDAKRTFEAAYSCDYKSITENNIKWLGSEWVRNTDGWAVWSRIAQYFESRLMARG